MKVMTKKFIKKSNSEGFIEYSFYMLKWGVHFMIQVYDKSGKFIATTYTRNHRNRIDESCEECFKRVIASRQKKHDFDDSRVTFYGMREMFT